MRADDAFYPPERYAAIWPIVALLVLLAVAVWLGFVWWCTRPDRSPTSRPLSRPGVAGPDPARSKRASIARIDQLVAEVESGRLDVRTGHQRVSEVVRDFVDRRSGAGAGAGALTMTLSDFGSGDPRLVPVAAVVRRLYPGEFGPDPAPPLRPIAEEAKAVIDGWT